MHTVKAQSVKPMGMGKASLSEHESQKEENTNRRPKKHAVLLQAFHRSEKAGNKNQLERELLSLTVKKTGTSAEKQHLILSTIHTIKK